MESTKTEEQLRDEWIHRPSHLKHLSFHEWKEERERSGFEPAATPISAQAGSRVQHETTKMNKLEAQYAAHLETRKTVGEILEYRFEPMKLRLAPRTYFDIDFLVLTPMFRATAKSADARTEEYAKVLTHILAMQTGIVELHEVKGHWEDDARVKMKVAATMFPWWTFRGVQWDKAAKDWKFEEFKA